MSSVHSWKEDVTCLFKDLEEEPIKPGSFPLSLWLLQFVSGQQRLCLQSPFLVKHLAHEAGCPLLSEWGGGQGEQPVGPQNAPVPHEPSGCRTGDLSQVPSSSRSKRLGDNEGPGASKRLNWRSPDYGENCTAGRLLLPLEMSMGCYRFRRRTRQN